MLARTSLESLLPAVCPMIASWLCLMMANPKVPLEPTLLLIAHHNKVSFFFRYIKVYCSKETLLFVHTCLCKHGCTYMHRLPLCLLSFSSVILQFYMSVSYFMYFDILILSVRWGEEIASRCPKWSSGKSWSQILPGWLWTV